jgi:hypothetical protein
MRWLAIGTGRCGTKSLVSHFADQHARHESVRLPWDLSVRGRAKAAKRIAQPEPEVSFMFTRWWETARSMDEDLPIVCMHRDKFDTVASHLRICGGQDRLNNNPPRMVGEFNSAYPNVDPTPSYLAWGLWYDLIEKIMGTVTGPVWHMQMLDLNDEQKMADLRTWLDAHGRIV